MSALESADQETSGRDRRMSLGAHLVELRRRLFIAAGALVVGMVIAFFVTGPIIELLSIPIRTIAEEAGRDYVGLNFTTVTSGFDLRMRIAFAIGLLISAPVWLWQVWAFVMPGLTKKETQYTWGFLGASIPLFFGGCTVAFFVLPHVIEIMASFVPTGMAQFFDYSTYYDFVFKFLLVLGIAFVLPVFLVALNLAGVMSGRDILKGWRVAILVCTIFAAITTPPADVFSMLLLMASMIVLYFAATFVSMLFDRRKRKRDEAAGIEPVSA
ncbi:sec-independent protein translocase protein TatC [Microbacterium phyllosphaerae]|uniref:Sec-independent protein translocase protein TatC n=2 Tax=Microbacteriaceae TaxID=85023 RepID=A0ABS4WR77_9MICO|nr:sec-independent protein translocase protein TatC [Microbacterium phyllosphaerae]MCS3441335.1 sec-independent protein translocase protein TatC [Microbacterium phyllosphaerae]